MIHAGRAALHDNGKLMCMGSFAHPFRLSCQRQGTGVLKQVLL